MSMFSFFKPNMVFLMILFSLFLSCAFGMVDFGKLIPSRLSCPSLWL